jgi:charged multivesicular body protein 2A
MAFLFKAPLTPAQQLRTHKRGIDRAIRDLERERTKLQQQEKKIIAEIRQVGPAPGRHGHDRKFPKEWQPMAVNGSVE